MNCDRWIICCFVALIFSSLSSLQAIDVVDFVEIANNNNPQIIEHQKGRFQRHLSLRITELKRVCDLTDKQAKKLDVASKGAVEEAMKQFVERFPQLKAQDQPPVLPGEPRLGVAAGQRLEQAIVEVPPQFEALPQADLVPAEAPDEPAPLVAEAVAADLILAAPVQIAPAPMVWQVHQNFQMEPSEAANTVVWRNAIDRVLTDPQKEGYREAQTQRRLYRRQTVVDRVVASVDRRLFLSDEQREKLSQIISDTVGENLDNMVPHGGFTSDSMVAAQVVTQVPKEKLVGVLDPAQIEGWNDVQHAQQGVVFGLR